MQLIETTQKNIELSESNSDVYSALIMPKERDYKTAVLKVNKDLKVESKTFKGAIKLLDALNKDSQTEIVIKAILDDSELYSVVKKKCRKSKAGNYAPFYILQALFKLGLTK